MPLRDAVDAPILIHPDDRMLWDVVWPGESPDRDLVPGTRVGAGGQGGGHDEEEGEGQPGSLVRMVSNELKARRFAGVVRLQVVPEMPRKRIKWLARQLQIEKGDIYIDEPLLAISDRRIKGIFWWEPASGCDRDYFDADCNARPVITVFDKYKRN